ncbi:hypothetical protein ACJJIP_13785 [Microbulbifer sp. VTAC004]|uniref:hypothetical protein n=1 Tax=unclassified Microbulbifer TaxID=2619833 RepID=UPI004039B26B
MAVKKSVLVVYVITLLFSQYAYSCEGDVCSEHFIYKLYDSVADYYDADAVKEYREVFLSEKSTIEDQKKLAERFINETPGYHQFVEDYYYFLGFDLDESSFANLVISAIFEEGATKTSFEYALLRSHAAYTYRTRVNEILYRKAPKKCGFSKVIILGDVITNSGDPIGWLDLADTNHKLIRCASDNRIWSYSLSKKRWQEITPSRAEGLLSDVVEDESDAAAIETLVSIVSARR